MISLQNFEQVAGNNWPKPTALMLHEDLSFDLAREPRFWYRNSMFEDLERQMRASETDFSKSIDMLRERYIFKDIEAVESFVRTHRAVAPLLIEAAPHFSAAFKDQVPVALDVLPDEEKFQTIYAFAIWNRDAAEARAALRTFDEGWLASNFQAFNGRIVFDYELI